MSGNLEGRSPGYDLAKSLSNVDTDVIKSFSRAPEWHDVLEKQMVTLGALIWLIAVTVAAALGLGLSWLLGALGPADVISLVIPGLLAVAWFAWIRVWRAGRQGRAQLERMRRRVTREAVDLNERFLARHVRGDEPFALFLRSFDCEAVVGFGTTAGRPRSAGTSDWHRPIEISLANALQGRIAAYAATNLIGSPGINYLSPLPRITIPSAVWREVLTDLIERASFVIADATEITTGLVTEFQMLDDRDRRQDTVVITPTEADRGRIAERNKMIALTGAEWMFSTVLDAAHSDLILAQFSRKVRSDQIDFPDIASVPAFCDLLRDTPRAHPSMQG